MAEPPSASPSDWTCHLQRWQDAGLIDPREAAAISRWEQARAQHEARRPELSRVLGWPVRLMILLGSLLLAAGLLLFVAAHWDHLSPLWRAVLLVLLTTGLHGGGSWFAEGFPAMGLGLHAVGTSSFGAAVFLFAQIFHLEVAWSFQWGLLLWSLGAAAGWLLLRQWPQLVLLSLLGPAWLMAVLTLQLDRFASEWFAQSGQIPFAAGAVLLALTYFTAPARPSPSEQKRVLMWVGGLALWPAIGAWLVCSLSRDPSAGWLPSFAWWSGLLWLLMLGGPMLLGWWLRRQRVWPLGIAMAWLLLDLQIPGQEITAFRYLWWGVGAFGLMAWGALEVRAERVNVGIGLFAITLLGFYVMEVMGRLERSFSLLGLGLLFLVGGWGLQRLRRRLLPAGGERRS